jgi:chromosome partitioning protein
MTEAARVITLAKRKGGVGASSVAGNIAGEFAYRNLRVTLLDSDRQGSCLSWAGGGIGANLGLTEQGYGVLGGITRAAYTESPREFNAILAKALHDSDLVVIDTASRFPVNSLEAIEASDLTIIPATASPMDVETAADAFEVAQSRVNSVTGKPLIRFLPSRNLPRTKLGRDLPGALAGLGAPVLPSITSRTAVAECVLEGMTVREWEPEGKACAEFSALADAIWDLIGGEDPNG